MMDEFQDVNISTDYGSQNEDNNEGYYECYDDEQYNEGDWTHNEGSYDQFDLPQNDTWQPEVDYMSDYFNDDQYPHPNAGNLELQ